MTIVLILLVVIVIVLLTAAAEPAIAEEIMPLKYNVKEITNFAINAGFSGDDLVTAVAVALAESKGDPRAYNPEIAAGTPQGMGSRGLWQIYAKVHPEFGPNFDMLYDPQLNANAAFSVYSAAGNSFKPWSTFKNGDYLAHVQAATDAVNA